MVFLLALSPILWLIVSLGFLKMQSFKACPIALIISFAVALAWYHMPGMDAATAALEGVALACWPILLVIIAAIFTYNLTLYTKSMDIVKHMLTTVSKDRRVLALLIGWGFGAFMEGMAGFGTAIAIPASMLVALGFDPIKAILVCLVANSVPTTYGSIGIPASTLANLTGLDPVQLSTYISLQLLPLNIICPFIIVAIVGGSLKALKGVFMITLLSALGLAVPGTHRFGLRRSGTGCHGGFYRHHGSHRRLFPFPSRRQSGICHGHQSGSRTAPRWSAGLPALHLDFCLLIADVETRSLHPCTAHGY